MKIALLSTNYDLGGAAIVTRRLTDALRALGHDARMIVARPGDEAGAQDRICVSRREWLLAFLRERAHLWLKGVKKADVFKVSTGLWGCALDEIPFVQEADLVIVGWASQGFLSLDTLEKLVASGRPVVYAMHDLYPATTLCHLPGTCERFTHTPPCLGCPYFRGSKRGDRLCEEIAERKRRIFMSPNLRLVAVSSWQKSVAHRSAILRGKEIEVIPHSFPVELYRATDKLADGKLHVVMAAARLDDPVKDLPAAVEALNILYYEHPEIAARVHVDFVGGLRDTSLLKALKVEHSVHGTVSTGRLRELYGQAAVVLSSSKYETMGATLMEGMAAGAIPATYGDAGQADIVTDAKNGFIAPVHTPAALSFALQMALLTADEVLQMAREGDEQGLVSKEEVAGFTPEALHRSVAERFAPEVIARRYTEWSA